MERRSEKERIIHLIPKRHIETWILCLNHIDVNEQENCKHHPNLNIGARLNRQLWPSLKEAARERCHLTSGLILCVPGFKKYRGSTES